MAPMAQALIFPRAPALFSTFLANPHQPWALDIQKDANLDTGWDDLHGLHPCHPHCDPSESVEFPPLGCPDQCHSGLLGACQEGSHNVLGRRHQITPLFVDRTLHEQACGSRSPSSPHYTMAPERMLC